MKKIIILALSIFGWSLLFSCSNRKDLALVEQGKALFLKQKYEEALPYFSKAIKKNTRNDQAHAYRGYCNLKLEKYSAALVDFSQALKRNPENGTALLGEGIIRWNLGDQRRAFADFNHLIQINPSHDKAYFYRGRAFLDNADTLHALQDLTTALKYDSCFVDSYYLLASILSAQKDYDQADYYLELALKCKQKNKDKQQIN